jgi:hypothetical protein
MFYTIGDALSAVLEPHWAAAMESDKEDVVFRTVMITIRVMALLSVKNVSNFSYFSRSKVYDCFFYHKRFTKRLYFCFLFCCSNSSSLNLF